MVGGFKYFFKSKPFLPQIDFFMLFTETETGSGEKDGQLLIIEQRLHCVVILHLVTFLFLMTQREHNKEGR